MTVTEVYGYALAPDVASVGATLRERGMRNTRRNRQWYALMINLAAQGEPQEHAETRAWVLLGIIEKMK